MRPETCKSTHFRVSVGWNAIKFSPKGYNGKVLTTLPMFPATVSWIAICGNSRFRYVPVIKTETETPFFHPVAIAPKIFQDHPRTFEESNLTPAENSDELSKMTGRLPKITEDYPGTSEDVQALFEGQQIIFKIFSYGLPRIVEDYPGRT